MDRPINLNAHEPDYSDYTDDESEMCPRCNGDGSVNCYCGGDLCICENYGEQDCPMCHGEGVVSSEAAERYFASRRKMRDVLATALAERTPDE